MKAATAKVGAEMARVEVEIGLAMEARVRAEVKTARANVVSEERQAEGSRVWRKPSAKPPRIPVPGRIVMSLCIHVRPILFV